VLVRTSKGSPSDHYCLGSTSESDSLFFGFGPVTTDTPLPLAAIELGLNKFKRFKNNCFHAT
jgi:hypothetical protein